MKVGIVPFTATVFGSGRIAKRRMVATAMAIFGANR
jgi:hypothetical protein